MKSILLPTDFSSNASRAIRYALSIFGDKVKYTLLNTYEVPYSGATMLISIADVLQKESEKALEEQLKTLQNEFPHLSDQIVIKSEMGVPETVVRHLSEKGKFGLVVMGTKGATGIKGVLIGSVASNVMQEVICPVLAVPESANLSVPRKILFAVDDNSLMEGVFPEKLASLVRRFDAELMVLNVVAEGEENGVGNAEEINRESISVFNGLKHSLHFVENNDVDEAIASFAKKEDVDMLAMVNRKNDLSSKFFGRSTTKKMMQHTNLPIIAFH
jgi:nucleotide-binding universal stress UspA family protein